MNKLLTLGIYFAMLAAVAPIKGHTQATAARVLDLAHAIVDHAGPEDPWVLAALAVKESRANPRVRIGALGECGAMQVLPRVLRPKGTWKCAYMQTSEGSVRSAVQAIGQFRAWAPRGTDPWDCYAAGESCVRGVGRRATRRLFTLRNRLEWTEVREGGCAFHNPVLH